MTAAQVKHRVQPVPRSVTLFELGEMDDGSKMKRSRSHSRGRKQSKVKPSHLPASATMPNCSVCQWVTQQAEHHRRDKAGHTHKTHQVDHSRKKQAEDCMTLGQQVDNRSKVRRSESNREGHVGRAGRTRERTKHHSAMPRSSSACYFTMTETPQTYRRVLSPDAVTNVAKRIVSPEAQQTRLRSPESRYVPAPRILSPEACRKATKSSGPSYRDAWDDNDEHRRGKSQQKPRDRTPDSDRQTTGCTMWIRSISQTRTTTYTRYICDIDADAYADGNRVYALENSRHVSQPVKSGKARDERTSRGYKSRSQQMEQVKNDLALQHKHKYERQRHQQQPQQQVFDKPDKHGKRERHAERHGGKRERQEKQDSQNPSRQLHKEQVHQRGWEDRHHRGPARIIYVDDPVSNIGVTCKMEKKRVSRHSSLEYGSSRVEIEKHYRRKSTWSKKKR